MESSLMNPREEARTRLKIIHPETWKDWRKDKGVPALALLSTEKNRDREELGRNGLWRCWFFLFLLKIRESD